MSARELEDFSRSYELAYGEFGSCSISFRAFDCANSITIYSCGCNEGTGSSLHVDERAEEWLLACRRLCLRYHALWSFTLHGSDVSRMNAAVYAVRVHPETASLLQHMLRLHADEPAFDFALGRASYLWKRARFTCEPPSDEELSAALAHTGASHLRLEGDVLHKDDPLVQVDVGAAAKGYVANALARYLGDAGVTCADIDLGGNLYLLGAQPAGRPWRLEVELPDALRSRVEARADGLAALAFEARDTSVVTSASFERTFEAGGRSYQHIIDPATGRPSESDIVSATVLSPDSVYADMLSTAVLVAGSAGFDALMARHANANCIAVTRDGRVLRAEQS